MIYIMQIFDILEMNVRFLKSPEKKEITESLKEVFGIQEIPYLLFETGKEKFRGFSGSLAKDEIIELSGFLNIEIIGSYLIKKENDLRLSFDAVHLFQNQITKNIFEINDSQFELWIRGHDLLDIKDLPKGTLVIKYKGDLIGCGRSNGEKIANYIPKERRLRTQLKPKTQ